jgi:DNA-binding FrmR family transcriptional regulator
MRECINIPAVNARLKRIGGQIQGISAMLEKDVPCEDILIQIAAAKAALHKVGQIVLEGHLHHCVVNGIKKGEIEETLQDLASAIEQFSRMV